MKLLVKFGEKRNLTECISKGSFHFSSARKYKDIEATEHIIGQGDDREATIKLPNVIRARVINEAGASLELHDFNMSVLLSAAADYPIFCISEIDSEDCIQTEIGLTIKPEFMNTIRSHFPKADSALIFHDRADFIRSMQKQFPTAKMGKVEYFFSPKNGVSLEYMLGLGTKVSRDEYIANCNNCYFAFCDQPISGGEWEYYLVREEDAYKSLFYKDSRFAGERELRIVLPDRKIPSGGENYCLETIDRSKLELVSLDEFENTILS